ncbi:TPA: hypothetical protein ACH3X1_009716 [Trebouxia sp. C0004]
MTDSFAYQFMPDMDAAIEQHFALVLAACAKLQSSPCQGGQVKAIWAQLNAAELSSFDGHAVANISHSLATLPAASPFTDVLDALCKQFNVLIKSRGKLQSFQRLRMLQSRYGHWLELLPDHRLAVLVGYPELSQPSLLNDAELNQLYQALDWLQLPQNADTQQGKAWLNLKEKLGRLGARPACATEQNPGAQLVCSALTHLSLRLIGSENFRQQLLRRKGKLVLLTPPRPGAAVHEVANYLEPMLTAAAGGSLDAYRFGASTSVICMVHVKRYAAHEFEVDRVCNSQA